MPNTHSPKPELEIAREIQQSFLPSTFPDVAGAEIAALMRPAYEVGGDFYDVIPLTLGRVGLLVGDISGKGVPAALYMALARTLLRSHSLDTRARYLSDALESASVRQLMRSGSLGALAALDSVSQTNNYLVAHHSQLSFFLTLFYGVYEPASHLLTYVNAGHNPPLVYNTLSGQIAWLKPNDMVIGLMPGRPFTAQEQQMQPGDVLVIYSDGITEAFDPDHQLFGQERLVEAVRSPGLASAGQFLQAIEAAVMAFAASTPQSDDITLLILYCPPGS
ncbi:MAG: PP2C family protein-serine/threonine phosphatase [Thermoflexales bacterium]|nr:PP2C family protein-serine/threonine phosphatase [Thermoflexales bacterium]